MHRIVLCFALLAIAFSSSLIRATEAAEMVDNPQYTSWAKCKPGTKITISQDLVFGAVHMSNSAAQRLIDVTPEKVVFHVVKTFNRDGQTDEKEEKVEVPAKVEKGQENLPANVTGTTKEIGSEKVEIAGKTYECKVVEFSGELVQGQSVSGKVSGKMWETPEIPGGLARMEMRVESAREMTVKMQTIGIELKS
jgi:hypothetical protein